MEKDRIIDIMKDYGFTCNMESRNGKGGTTALYFMSEPSFHRRHKDQIVIPSFGCTVYPNGDFAFNYAIPGSINKLDTPKCGPVTNEKHFNNICLKFESAVRVLYAEFGE